MESTHLTPAPHFSAVSQQPCRLAISLGLAALLLVLTGAALGTHAALASYKPAASRVCRTMQVTLHGNAAPSLSCLDGQRTVRTRSTGGSGPLAHLAFATSCSAAALVLYWNTLNYGSNTVLCINGSGLLNLTGSWGVGTIKRVPGGPGATGTIFILMWTGVGAMPMPLAAMGEKNPHSGTSATRVFQTIRCHPSTRRLTKGGRGASTHEC
jgi:hypothetical protein